MLRGPLQVNMLAFIVACAQAICLTPSPFPKIEAQSAGHNKLAPTSTPSPRCPSFVDEPQLN